MTYEDQEWTVFISSMSKKSSIVGRFIIAIKVLKRSTYISALNVRRSFSPILPKDKESFLDRLHFIYDMVCHNAVAVSDVRSYWSTILQLLSKQRFMTVFLLSHTDSWPSLSEKSQRYEIKELVDVYKICNKFGLIVNNRVQISRSRYY